MIIISPIYSHPKQNLNELLFILIVFLLNNKKTIKNKLHNKVANINNSSCNMNNNVGIDFDISKQ